jgi:hypothetical protein
MPLFFHRLMEWYAPNDAPPEKKKTKKKNLKEFFFKKIAHCGTWYSPFRFLFSFSFCFLSVWYLPSSRPFLYWMTAVWLSETTSTLSVFGSIFLGWYFSRQPSCRMCGVIQPTCSRHMRAAVYSSWFSSWSMVSAYGGVHKHPLLHYYIIPIHSSTTPGTGVEMHALRDMIHRLTWRVMSCV